MPCFLMESQSTLTQTWRTQRTPLPSSSTPPKPRNHHQPKFNDDFPATYCPLTDAASHPLSISCNVLSSYQCSLPCPLQLSLLHPATTIRQWLSCNGLFMYQYSLSFHPPAYTLPVAKIQQWLSFNVLSSYQYCLPAPILPHKPPPQIVYQWLL